MREEGGELITQWNVDKERRTLTEPLSKQKGSKPDRTFSNKEFLSLTR